MVGLIVGVNCSGANCRGTIVWWLGKEGAVHSVSIPLVVNRCRFAMCVIQP